MESSILVPVPDLIMRDFWLVKTNVRHLFIDHMNEHEWTIKIIYIPRIIIIAK